MEGEERPANRRVGVLLGLKLGESRGGETVVLSVVNHLDIAGWAIVWVLQLGL